MPPIPVGLLPRLLAGACRFGAGGRRGIQFVLLLFPLLPSSGVAGLLYGCPLSQADVDRYRSLFLLEGEGQPQRMEQLSGRLDSDLLLGHLRARKLESSNQVTPAQLAAWLDAYSDHYQAPEVALRLHRMLPDAELPGLLMEGREDPAPDTLANASPLFPRTFYRSDKTLSHSEYRRLQQLKREIRGNLRNTRLSATARLLGSQDVGRLFDRFEVNSARSDLAAAWLYYGDVKKASELASGVAAESGERLPISYWTAGLSAWQLGQFAEATDAFERFASSPELSPWNQAAGGFWAARGHLRQGHLVEARAWLTYATAFPRTFYGLLARHRLGLPPAVDTAVQPLECGQIAGLADSAGGMRAVALAQVGEVEAARRELLALTEWDRPDRALAMLRLAHEVGLHNFALELAERLRQSDPLNWRFDQLDPYLYPRTDFAPRDGFKLDRALLLAVTRQESAFDPRAGSEDGALGLMQLLPRTAAHLAPEYEFEGRDQSALYEPGLNMELGQKYLQQLMRSERFGGDLFHLAASYNAGPGNLGKWKRQLEGMDEDPLLFIETIPARETRLFIERVMANLWVYRAALGQQAPSLDDLAYNDWPRYRSLDLPAVDLSMTAPP